jgi:hypothetical protein
VVQNIENFRVHCGGFASKGGRGANRFGIVEAHGKELQLLGARARAVCRSSAANLFLSGLSRDMNHSLSHSQPPRQADTHRIVPCRYKPGA